jgi:hypothetical protein
MKRTMIVAMVLLGSLAFTAVVGAQQGSQPPPAKAADGDVQAVLKQLQAQVQALQAELAEVRSEVAALQERLAKAGAQLVSASAPAAEAPLSHTLDIRVEPGAWGGASAADMQKVLLSSAGELWKHFPERKLKPIIIQRSKEGPITLYRKGAGGEYIVRLDVEGTFWCQFAYQFAHEFCHILTNYERRKTDKNQWFEESLGELASMYAVAAMGQTWQTAPPYPNWKSYAPNLTKYADELLRKEGSDLPAGQTLAAWYKANESALRRDPYDRAKNRIVAKLLLPVMQESSQSWEAFGYLNNSPPDGEASFASYLSAWYKDAPAKHQPFAKRVAEMFGVALSDSSAAGK